MADNKCNGCPVMDDILDDIPDAELNCDSCGEYESDGYEYNGCSHSPWDMNA